MKKARLLRDCYRTKPTPPDTIKNRARNPAEVLTETKPGREATNFKTMRNPNLKLEDLKAENVTGQLFFCTFLAEATTSEGKTVKILSEADGSIIIEIKNKEGKQESKYRLKSKDVAMAVFVASLQ